MAAVEYDQELDCQGLNCPLPILKTKQAIDGMASGQVLKMIATDPGSVKDMEAWVRQTGHELVDEAVAGDQYIYYVRKK